ncbi:hypothetical protein GYMLUDRAFT_242492 [Collybiopsis luxurians FD-317 M1]|uniref:Uncharacterized protein n=1 Tax=Collybiopsis luxurians FD-317 M1 TaxID=944289 RepID=A0A0D0CJB4_9AGAR|nr:hypothetical protein GYMLUDRAFT_242492 [Collybiopsis luxurians FD-317 M1]
MSNQVFSMDNIQITGEVKSIHVEVKQTIRAPPGYYLSRSLCSSAITVSYFIFLYFSPGSSYPSVVHTLSCASEDFVLISFTIQNAFLPAINFPPSKLFANKPHSHFQANPTLAQVDLKNQAALRNLVALNPGDSVPDITSFVVLDAANT